MKIIKYCSSEFLTYYKANFETEYLPLYINGDIKKFENIFSDDILNVNEKFTFNYEKLALPQKIRTNSDYIMKNCETLHKSLHMLTPSQASREELWFTLFHTYYLEYLLEYVQTIIDDKDFISKLKNAIFFTTTNSKSLLTHHLARFWWTSYHLLDFENSEDIYWLTKFFTSHDSSRKISFVLASKITNNRNLTLGIIDAVYQGVQEGKLKNSLDTYLLILKQFNMIGGVRILDILSREQIKLETQIYLKQVWTNKIKISTKQKSQIFDIKTGN